jgi:hypothetical protein
MCLPARPRGRPTLATTAARLVVIREYWDENVCEGAGVMHGTSVVNHLVGSRRGLGGGVPLLPILRGDDGGIPTQLEVGQFVVFAGATPHSAIAAIEEKIGDVMPLL